MQAESLKTDKLIEEEKLKIDAFNAETNRLKVVQTGMTPEQTQMLVTDTITESVQNNIYPILSAMAETIAQPQPQATKKVSSIRKQPDGSWQVETDHIIQ